MIIKYLEKIQWCVRPAQLIDSPPLGDNLQVELNDFTTEEVRRVVRKLKLGKAPGHDDIPPEFLKALLSNTANKSKKIALALNASKLAKKKAETHRKNTVQSLVNKYVILRAQAGACAHNTAQQPFLPPRRPPSTLVCFVFS